MKKILTLVLMSIVVLGLSACQGSNNAVVNPSGRVLFEDDFSDPKSGWQDLKGEPGTVGYVDGEYQMNIAVPFYTSWVTPEKFYNDVSIEVDARQTAGSEKSLYGVVCRVMDEKNFYVFALSNAGYYGIGKVVDGQGPTMMGTDGPDKLLASDVIKKGSEVNHIKVDCKGNTLTLSVNGQQLSSVQDDSIDSGDIGLLAKTFEEPGLSLVFDNFSAKIP